ncbi:stage II sporulation protein R [Solibacillus sp. A46]|uniref:Stage II sporulation protein R n=1 Tax=Solibacillus faecavium TaxID=2762221 RepID=A0ABR8Y0N4_9BACL|nr:stage II sporulation protein R [Solibacillus faecavium]MBD8037722.1 stage II sporulation protein R [Solibacillus faecavium]
MLHDYDIKNESNLFLAVAKLLISVLFIYSAACIVPDFVEGVREGQALSDEQLKIRVIANSSTKADQLVKYEVVETIQGYMQETSDFSEDIHSVEKIYQEIQKTYPQLKVSYKFGDNLMPPKWYLGQFYPQNKYYSVNFVIGQGRGENWFCAVFPTLCKKDEPAKTERPTFYISEWWKKNKQKSNQQKIKEYTQVTVSY